MQKKIESYFLENGWDGFLIKKPENVFWLSGFKGSFGFVILLFSRHEKILVTDSRYAEKAQKILESQKNEWAFLEFNKDFSKTHKNKFLGTFGIEDSISIAELKAFKKLFPKIKFKPQSQFLENLRRKKTATEILKIKNAQNQVDKILIPFLKTNLKTGITEKFLALKLEETLKENGKFELSFPAIVAFSENSSIPHHEPGDRTLKFGDNILIDCGTKFEGFCSDMTRNFVFGTPSDEYVEKYKKLLKVQNATIEKMFCGAKIVEIDRFCRKSLGEDNSYFTHSLGHGVGLEIHELPNISSSKKSKNSGFKKSLSQLQEHDMVTCEPGIYFPGKFGIRIEDLLLITKKKPRILSQTTKDLLCFNENGTVKIVDS